MIQLCNYIFSRGSGVVRALYHPLFGGVHISTGPCSDLILDCVVPGRIFVEDMLQKRCTPNILFLSNKNHINIIYGYVRGGADALLISVLCDPGLLVRRD